MSEEEKQTSDLSLKGTAVPSSPTEAPRALGKYRIIRRLGKGGMASVFLARDTILDREVALKVPHLSVTASKSGVERFWREARAAARIRHPNICPVHEVAEIDGVQFIAMDFIDGLSLAEFASHATVLPQRDVARITLKIVKAMQEAHRHGVIHRDLKPANIIVDKRREPILMDFGVAWHPEGEGQRLTRGGGIVGTPAYMAPEQIDPSHGPISAQCDIYSLGVMMYELLTGRLPFDGEIGQVLLQLVTVDAIPPSRYRADLDPRLEAICLRAIAKPLDRRYRRMDEFASDLTDYLKSPDSRALEAKALAESETIVDQDTAPSREGSRTPKSTPSDRTTPRSRARIEQDTPRSLKARPSRTGSQRSKHDPALHAVMKWMTVATLALVGAVAGLMLITHVMVPALERLGVGRPHESTTYSEEDLSALPSAEQGILPAVEVAALPLSGSAPIEIVFPPVNTINGHFLQEKLEVTLDGRTLLTQEFPGKRDWGSRLDSPQLIPIQPKAQIPRSAIPASSIVHGKALNLVINLHVTYPAVASGEQGFVERQDELSRRIKLVVR